MRRQGHIFGTVYLVHFSRAFKGAQHYLGFTTNLSQRMREHRAGKGNGLIAAAIRAGASVRVVRKWGGVDGFFETLLKGGHDNRALCPVCNPKGKGRAYARAGAKRKLQSHKLR